MGLRRCRPYAAHRDGERGSQRGDEAAQCACGLGGCGEITIAHRPLELLEPDVEPGRIGTVHQRLDAVGR